ncbi:MAG: hypothetical protein JSR21_17595 [Proteobacteria bacterium]|nr:hypothetical protein [Pseudomonadota bacterium]
MTALVQIGWRAALVLTGAAFLAAETVTPWEIPQATAPAAASSPAAFAPPPARGGGDYPAIAAHPLFHPSRAPWTPPPPAAAPAPDGAVTGPLDGFVLTGMVGSGNARTAILRGGDGKSVLLSEGDALNGWTVRRIDADGLHLESGTMTTDLTFPHAQAGAR